MMPHFFAMGAMASSADVPAAKVSAIPMIPTSGIPAPFPIPLNIEFVRCRHDSLTASARLAASTIGNSEVCSGEKSAAKNSESIVSDVSSPVASASFSRASGYHI